MPTQSRAAPHLVLGIFTVLAVLAILLSLATAPAIAQEQVRTAAADTEGASSFVTTYTYAVSQAGTGTKRLVVRFIYQAPDRVEEIGVSSSGTQVTLLSIGTDRYLKQGTAGWVRFANATGTSYGLLAAQSIVGPLKSVAKSPSATAHGDMFAITPADEASFVSQVLGYQPAQLSPGTLKVTASVAGEFVSQIEATATMGSSRLDAVLAFTEIDHVPALVAPVGAPLSSTAP